MAKINMIDLPAAYQEMARAAKSNAATSTDPIIGHSCRLASGECEHPACLRAEICFCGRAAIGSKFYPGNERMPYCGDHLAEAITQDVLFRMNVRRPN